MLKIHSKIIQKFFARKKKEKLGLNDFLKNKPILLEEELSNFTFKVFADEAICKAITGQGGDGKNSRIITRSITTGNYDGGNGGKGGDIIFKAIESVDYNLSQFSNQEFFSGEGHDGKINYTKGKDAKTLQVSLPIGTQVYEIKYDERNGQQWNLIKNLDNKNDQIQVAKGGRGGLGSSDKNFNLNRLRGNQGQQKEIGLKLRIPNDIALVGLSCSGKSFLMAKLTQAISKISEFQNNTKIPILGKLRFLNNRIYKILDLPPMQYRQGQEYIDKWEFSKHLTFTKVVLVVVDISSVNFFEAILAILRYFKKMELKDKQILFVLNKIDLINENQKKALEYRFNTLDFKYVFISALKGQGIIELLDNIKKLIPEFKKYNQNLNQQNKNIKNKDVKIFHVFFPSYNKTLLSQEVDVNSALSAFN